VFKSFFVFFYVNNATPQSITGVINRRIHSSKLFGIIQSDLSLFSSPLYSKDFAWISLSFVLENDIASVPKQQGHTPTHRTHI
jgi:hypothetical protein